MDVLACELRFMCVVYNILFRFFFLGSSLWRFWRAFAWAVCVAMMSFLNFRLVRCYHDICGYKYWRTYM
jgi:hypothetical protein